MGAWNFVDLVRRIVLLHEQENRVGLLRMTTEVSEAYRTNGITLEQRGCTMRLITNLLDDMAERGIKE